MSFTMTPNVGDDDPDASRLNAELQEIRNALAVGITSWARLEDSLAMLFSTAICDQYDIEIGHLIYFTPTATETRIKIVSTAVNHVLRKACADPRLATLFGKILENVNKRKQVRNKLAHGDIFICGITSGSRQARLTNTMISTISGHASWRGAQFPGMSANDIRVWTKATQEAQGDIFSLSILVAGARNLPVAHPPEIRELVLQGLLARLAPARQ